jgi:hypothetical protein
MLSLREKSFKKTHNQILINMNEIKATLNNQKKYEIVFAIYKQILIQRKKILKLKYLNTLININNLIKILKY